MRQAVCDWCGTLNPAGDQTCVACGAPLEAGAPEPAVPMNVAVISVPPPVSSQAGELDDLRQAGETAERAYHQALSVYAGLWRTLAEAAAISLAGLALGLIGAAVGLAGWGLLAAGVVGLVVGLTTKNYWLTALGAPLGALAGAVLWLFPWVLGLSVQGMVFSTGVLAVLGALVGRRPSAAHKNVWDRLRPWLGLTGGLLFGGIGVLVGLALLWMVKSLIR